MVSPASASAPIALPPGTALPWGTYLKRLVRDLGDTLIYAAINSVGESIWVWEAVPRGAKRAADGTWTAVEITTHELRVMAWREHAHWEAAGGLGGVVVGSPTVYGNTIFAESEPLVHLRPLREAIEQGFTWPPIDDVDREWKRLLIAVDAWHRRGLVHGGICADRIWVGPDGTTYLAPGGHRSVWEADRLEPLDGEFPPEYREPRMPLTPAYDLFALVLVWGEAGLYEGRVKEVMEACLHASPATRPRSAGEALRAMKADYVPPSPRSWQDMDVVRQAVQSLRYARRECPVCHGPLESPGPLKKGRCPVCHRGTIRDLRPRDGVCPDCHFGTLTTLSTGRKSPPCPQCAEGRMEKRRRKWVCRLCEYEGEPGAEDGRRTMICELCDARFAHVAPGVWRDTRSPRFLTDEEIRWSSLRSGPGSAPKVCDACEAGFIEGAGHVTLVSRPPLSEGFFVDGYEGRALDADELRWVAVGQTSLATGFICARGDVEFDDEPGGWKLVRTSSEALAPYVGQVNSPEDWHRLARGLPVVADEEAFEVRFERAIRLAYQMGELGLDGRANMLLWNSTAMLRDGKKRRKGFLHITPDSLAFRAPFRRQGTSLAALDRCLAEGSHLKIWFREADASWEFELPSYLWTVETKSGKTRLTLTAEDLAARLNQKR